MPTNISSDEQDFKKLLDQKISEDDLAELIADSSGLAADAVDKKSKGNRIFSRIWKSNQEAVCINPLVQAYIRDPSTSDAVRIATLSLAS